MIVKNSQFEKKRERKDVIKLKAKFFSHQVEVISGEMNELSRYLTTLPEEIRHLIRTGHHEDVRHCIAELTKNGNRMLNLASTIDALSKNERRSR